MTDSGILIWFNVVIILLLILDLGLIQRRAHFPSMKEALGWTAFWVSLAVGFGLFILSTKGHEKALEFFTGYIVEEALSVDNVFVFIVIFSYFSVPNELHHRVLFWGVLGAIVFRAAFIVAGAALVAQFHWILYLLGVFLVITAIKLAVHGDAEIEPERNPFVRFCRRFFPITAHYAGAKFLVRHGGKLSMTPLLLVLIVIETTDIAFATDSIPAIFAITRDTFIIYTSNIFAILGLRALYFVVSGFMRQFRYLKVGLSLVLGFIGLKMLLEPWLRIPIQYSLLTIFSVLLTSVLVSLVPPRARKTTHKQ